MPWHSIRNEAEIERILDFVIQEGTELEVRIPGDEITYFSKGLRLIPPDKGDCLEGFNKKGREISIGGLVPVIGNERVRTCPEADIFFSFRQFLCKFHSIFHSEFPRFPHEDHLISFPGLMEVEEKRREERLLSGSPDFISAVFSLGDDRQPVRHHELPVLNYSGHGIGLLVREKESELLQELQPGNLIPEVILFAEGLTMKFPAIVRHKTEIDEGPNAGVLVGLESEVSLEDFFDELSSAPSRIS